MEDVGIIAVLEQDEVHFHVVDMDYWFKVKDRYDKIEVGKEFDFSEGIIAELEAYELESFGLQTFNMHKLYWEYRIRGMLVIPAS